MENHASHRGDKSRADAGASQPREGNVVFREEVDAADAALEYADVPLAVVFHASRRLDHWSSAVRTGGRLGHGAEATPHTPGMFRTVVWSIAQLLKRS